MHKTYNTSGSQAMAMATTATERATSIRQLISQSRRRQRAVASTTGRNLTLTPIATLMSVLRLWLMWCVYAVVLVVIVVLLYCLLASSVSCRKLYEVRTEAFGARHSSAIAVKRRCTSRAAAGKLATGNEQRAKDKGNEHVYKAQAAQQSPQQQRQR